jgi:GH24 family phage-related lysozyme (muramidase)
MDYKPLVLALFLAGCDQQPMVVSQPIEAIQTVSMVQTRIVKEDTTDSILGLPEKATITPAAHSLILSFEGFDARPAWPGEASGVTIGWGYDCGYSDKSVIESDWHKLSDQPRHRLADTSGKTGMRAKQVVPALRDINIGRDVGTEVFDDVDVTRWVTATRKVVPGFDNLRHNCQGALVSLGYNRGWSLIGDNRREMRAIVSLAPKQDYSGMANQVRSMTRIWRGTSIENGMKRRRYAEAALIETP